MLTQHQRLLDNCILNTKQIDVWQYPLHTEFPNAEAYLSAQELARANRFYFPRHRRRFIIAHSVLRLIMARYLNETANQIEFTEGKYGKPELLNSSFLQFNLSHSGDMALLAIGKKHSLGVDVEHFSARPLIGIGKQLFSEKENERLQNTKKSLIPLVFFNIWAQKEALIKACGMGLSYPTQQFDVPSLVFTPETITDTLHQKTWKMITFMPKIGCCAALCYEPDIQNIRYSVLTTQQLITLTDLQNN